MPTPNAIPQPPMSPPPSPKIPMPSPKPSHGIGKTIAFSLLTVAVLAGVSVGVLLLLKNAAQKPLVKDEVAVKSPLNFLSLDILANAPKVYTYEAGDNPLDSFCQPKNFDPRKSIIAKDAKGEYYIKGSEYYNEVNNSGFNVIPLSAPAGYKITAYEFACASQADYVIDVLKNGVRQTLFNYVYDYYAISLDGNYLYIENDTQQEDEWVRLQRIVDLQKNTENVIPDVNCADIAKGFFEGNKLITYGYEKDYSADMCIWNSSAELVSHFNIYLKSAYPEEGGPIGEPFGLLPDDSNVFWAYTMKEDGDTCALYAQDLTKPDSQVVSYDILKQSDYADPLSHCASPSVDFNFAGFTLDGKSTFEYVVEDEYKKLANNQESITEVLEDDCDGEANEYYDLGFGVEHTYQGNITPQMTVTAVLSCDHENVTISGAVTQVINGKEYSDTGELTDLSWGTEVIDFKTDYNFDGYNDLSMKSQNAPSRSGIDISLIFLYDSHLKQFVYSKILSDIPNIYIDQSDDKTILGYPYCANDFDEICDTYEHYVWDNGTLKLVTSSGDDPYQLVVDSITDYDLTLSSKVSVNKLCIYDVDSFPDADPVAGEKIYQIREKHSTNCNGGSEDPLLFLVRVDLNSGELKSYAFSEYFSDNYQ